MAVRPRFRLTRRGRLLLVPVVAAAVAGTVWVLADLGTTPPVATMSGGTGSTSTPSPAPSPSPPPPARVERQAVEPGARWTGEDPAVVAALAVEGMLAVAPVVVVAEGPALTPARGVAWRLHAPLLPLAAPDLSGLLDRLGTTTVVHVAASSPDPTTSPSGSSTASVPDLSAPGRDVVHVPVTDGAVDRSALEDVAAPDRPEGDAPVVLVRADDPARPLLDTIALAADVPLIPVDGALARDPAAVRRLRASGEAPWAVAGSADAWAGTRPRVLAWDVEVARSGMELPGGGLRMFPDRLLVAMYGSPDAASLGILGEQPVGPSVERARRLAEDYAPLVDEVVVPTFEIIATVASGSAGSAGDYSIRVPHARIEPWIDAAADAGVYVILDLQPGRTDFLTQARELEPLLRHPHVGLALDPEWRLRPDQVHLRQIGSVSVEEVQSVADWLADLTREAGLPQKLLLLHQFRLSMLPGIDALEAPPELAVAIQMDGQGSQGAKDGTWQSITTTAPPDDVWWGWKNFYDEDTTLRSPADTLAVEPTPVLVSYQ